MINGIVEGISVAISDWFGEKYKIYAEEIPQGFREPCFFISCINSSERRLVGNRYFTENMFCVQYFPEDKRNKNAECRKIAEGLFSCLEWIEADGEPVMGNGMKYEIFEGVMSFFVDYNMATYKRKEQAVVMENLKENISMKG